MQPIVAGPERSATLIERDQQVDALFAAVASAVAGRGKTVVISGEAGIGKTALLQEFAARKPAGTQLLWGGSDALFTPQPLGPLRDMAGEIDPGIAKLLKDVAAQDQIFPALLQVLQNGHGNDTRVLFFEDVHWADNATLDLIKYLGRRIAYLRVVLVLTLRSDEVGAGHALSQVLGELPTASTIRMMLKPLSAAGIAQLARASNQDAAELHRVTMGNPFFATELLANTDLAGSGIPASVRDAVWARLQRLAPKERELLEAVSIAPSGAEDWFAEALIGENADTAIDTCVARSLLFKDGEGRFRFRHELARAATMERLPPATQKQLHRRAFAALSGRASFPLSCLTHHAAGAGDSESVLALAPRAAAEAIKLGAHREAVTHLATAISHSATALPEVLAQLYEDWAYQSSLALKIDQPILDGARMAVELWRGLGRADKVALNLRRLSRYHWYRGERQLTVQFADEAIAALADVPPGRDLAMAYSARAQLYMFNDQFDEAIVLSRKAIALAEQTHDIETRIHALNNLGGSMLFAGSADGKPYMEESLALALAHGFHDLANRAYMNYGEYAILAKEFDVAERLLSEAIAFNTKQDLDANIQMLSGRLAQLRLEQGRFDEAETIAAGVLGIQGLALVVQLPARFMLAKTRMRLGKDDGSARVQQALVDALKTEEQQHIVPARLTAIELAWLHGDVRAAHAQLEALSLLRLDGLDSWDMGSFAVWWKRCGMPGVFPYPKAQIATAREAEIRAETEAAAREWNRLGQPYEAALALMSKPDCLAQAVAMLDELGAKPAAALTREMAKQNGISLKAAAKRGPYGAARRHPLGLTSREAEVFDLLVQGHSNTVIAKRLKRSPRTVEHHVSALLGKLNASSRMDVLLRLRNEPWLAAGVA